MPPRSHNRCNREIYLLSSKPFARTAVLPSIYNDHKCRSTSRSDVTQKRTKWYYTYTYWGRQAWSPSALKFPALFLESYRFSWEHAENKSVILRSNSIFMVNHLDDLVTRIPFWMESGSVGSPCMFQSPMVPMSTRKGMMSRFCVTGIFRTCPQRKQNAKRRLSTGRNVKKCPKQSINC